MGDPSAGGTGDEGRQDVTSELQITLVSRQRDKATLECMAGSIPVHRDSIRIDAQSERDQFLEKVLANAPGAAPLRAQLAAQLLELASKKPSSGKSRDDKATAVLGVVRPACALLFTADDPQRTPFVDFLVDGHRETHPIDGEHFRGHIRQIVYRSFKQAIPEALARDVQATLAAEARESGQSRKVHVRVAPYTDKVFIDLCNDKWQVIEVDAEGYRVMPVAPEHVRFRRTSSMLPLPFPSDKEDASLETLRRFLRCRTDNDFLMTILWQVAALRGRAPLPIMTLSGEQGTGKTSFCRALQNLIDPSSIGLDSLPGDQRTLMLAAKSTWLLAFDNVSSIPKWLSDAMCRIATGAGWRHRRNYTDEEFTLFAGVRPQLLNGIPDVANRPDFAERSIVIRLAPFTDTERRTEYDFWKEFEAAGPRMFAALLIGVSAVLRHERSITIIKKPRMADFAEVAVAAGGAFEWDQETVLQAYAANQAEQVETLLATDTVAESVRLLLEGYPKGCWEGTATQLYALLENRLVSEGLMRDHNWPSSAEQLATHLRRIKPALAQIGIKLETGRKADRRFIKMTRSKVQQTLPGMTEMTQPTNEWGEPQ